MTRHLTEGCTRAALACPGNATFEQPAGLPLVCGQIQIHSNSNPVLVAVRVGHSSPQSPRHAHRLLRTSNSGSRYISNFTACQVNLITIVSCTRCPGSLFQAGIGDQRTDRCYWLRKRT